MQIALGEDNDVIPVAFENDASTYERQVGSGGGQKAQDMQCKWMKTTLTFPPTTKRGATGHFASVAVSSPRTTGQTPGCTGLAFKS